jgi:hypothetical protein
MRSPNAKSVEEAVQQLKTAESIFLLTHNGKGLFYTPSDAWENFRSHCQQLSQWIEHGRGVTEEMKPDLVKILFVSEKILSEHDKYDPRKRR